MSARVKIVSAFVVGALIGAFSAVQVAPNIQRTTQVAVQPTGPGGVDNGPGVGPAATVGAGPVDPANPGGGLKSPPPGIQCAAGRNGGKTDTGVTDKTIKLATTVVRSGTGAAFLGEVQFAMEAIKNKINRAGGICGRKLVISYIDDGWDAQKGSGYLRNIIKSGVFAIPVAPSSEGLRVVIDNGDIDEARVPVVGTDGMLIDQYLKIPGNGKAQTWVWSVATATASSARIMVRDAWSRGARSFGIVFDKNYRFGAEAAAAFNREVRELTGNNVNGYNADNNCQNVYCGVEAAQPSYSTEVNQFNKVKPSPDFMAMFLEPTTALTWMATPGAPSANEGASNKIRYGIGAAQPLFTRAFATSCQTACDQMRVWTSYRPPIENYANNELVRQFTADLRRTKPDADVFNAFSEGGYIGMMLLVEALQKVGPYLTRDALRQALNSMKFASGLTIQPVLSWTPSNHFANVTMQAFTIEYKSTFGGWRAGQIVRDINPERGIG